MKSKMKNVVLTASLAISIFVFPNQVSAQFTFNGTEYPGTPNAFVTSPAPAQRQYRNPNNENLVDLIYSPRSLSCSEGLFDIGFEYCDLLIDVELTLNANQREADITVSCSAEIEIERSENISPFPDRPYEQTTETIHLGNSNAYGTLIVPFELLDLSGTSVLSAHYLQATCFIDEVLWLDAK